MNELCIEGTTESVLIVGTNTAVALAWYDVLSDAGRLVARVDGPADLRCASSLQSAWLIIVEVTPSFALDDSDFQNLTTNGQRPAVLFVIADFSAPNVVNLARVGDMVLPAPLGPETLLQAVDLLQTRSRQSAAPPPASGRRDRVVEFARNYRLSPRETDLLRCAVGGMNNDEAASALGCSRGTVSTFWHRIFKKTRVSGQRDVIILLMRATQE